MTERKLATTMHCPPGCAEHAEHFYVLQIEMGPLPGVVPPFTADDNPFVVLAEEVADLVMPQRPLGCDVGMSGFVVSGEALGLDGD